MGTIAGNPGRRELPLLGHYVAAEWGLAGDDSGGYGQGKELVCAGREGLTGGGSGGTGVAQRCARSAELCAHGGASLVDGYGAY